MHDAPFFADVANGPEGGAAWWLQTDDGVRIRVGAWNPKEAQGTVLLFPGRTEYVEKYGPAATALAERGYASLAIDWRGQGLADRFLPDRVIGHVNCFADYQSDVRAAVAAAHALALPRPFHVIGHSMGGAIALRAVIEGLDVETAAFSAPMWGIVMSPFMRPFARTISGASRPIGLGSRYTPGTPAGVYVTATTFEENRLTRDRAMFEFMQRQLTAHPELGLGGPSLAWLNEALNEIRLLKAMRLPSIPAYCAVGEQEKIVDKVQIGALANRWPTARFEIYGGAEHELLMETPAIRSRFFDTVTAMFDGDANPAARGAAAC